jgi:tRNA(fMet)-specific endonuclease VapC
LPYILDADWTIQALAGVSSYVETLRRLEPDGLAISWVTVGEVYEGAFGLPNPQGHLASFRRFLQSLRILGLNDPIMERFAQIRALLRRRGEIIPDLDIIVGATALQHDLTVLTDDKHLARIPGLKLYQATK